jgi:integrase/recombinase XerC
MLRKLESDTALASVGLVDPFAEHRTRTLAEHLKDYASHLHAKGDTANHAEQTVARVRALFDGCEWKVYGNIDAARASEWLTALRQAAPSVTVPPQKVEYTPAEVADLFGISGAAVRATIKRHGLAATGNGKARKYPRETVAALVDRMGRGVGPATVNHYVRAIRGFFTDRCAKAVELS